MIFRSQRDRYFTIMMASAVTVIAAVTLLPVIFDKNATLGTVLFMVGIFLFTTAFLLWIIFSIQYVFEEDHLFVKGGPFRSRIPYNEITLVTRATNIFAGYRILTSRNALELFYQNAWLGSIKISPKDEEIFLMELKKRCPQAEFRI